MDSMQLSRLILLIPAAIFWSGCHTVRVESSLGPDVDWSAYSTFSFQETSSSTSDSRLSAQNLERIQEAIRGQLLKRGYQVSDEPDLKLSVYLRVADKVFKGSEANTKEGPMFYNIQKYYGFYYGYEHRWNENNEIEYQEGTLLVDLVDARATRLIWQGVAIGVLYDNRTDERVADRIREAVTLMFKKFPGKAP